MKKDNQIWIFVGLGILLLLIIPQLNLDFFKPKEEGFGMNIQYYKNGIEVFPKKSFLGFSVVNPPGGTYDQIALNIFGTSQNKLFTNIKIVDASPLAFKNVLPTTIQSLSGGQSKTLWGSNLMNTTQFESISPVNFYIRISGNEVKTECIGAQEFPCGEIDTEVDCYESPPLGLECYWDEIQAFAIVTPSGTCIAKPCSTWDDAPSLCEVVTGCSVSETGLGNTFYVEAYSGDISFEKEETKTQSFWSGLFSIVNLGGQTYHTFSEPSEQSFSYVGSGYVTGILIIRGGSSPMTCAITIDETSFLETTIWTGTSFIINNENIMRFENSFGIDCGSSGGAFFISYMTD